MIAAIASLPLDRPYNLVEMSVPYDCQHMLTLVMNLQAELSLQRFCQKTHKLL